MSETEQKTKRPIDRKRESAGSFTMGSSDETAAEMFVLDGRLLTVMTKGVYILRTADSVDPNRTDINLPNMMTQQVLGYGSESPFISRTLLAARELFRRGYLGMDFDEQRALRLAFEVAQHLASMMDLKVAFERDRELAAKELQRTPVTPGFKLPVTPNLRSRGEAFIRHADKANQSTKELSELFFPRKKTNDSWPAHIVQVLQQGTSSNEKSNEFLLGVISLIAAVREFRNASEHPDPTKEVTLRDFDIQPGLKVVPPSIEIRHPKYSVARTDLLTFMSTLIEECSRIFEGMAALLCSESIKVPDVISCQVALLDEAQSRARHGISFAYYATFKPGVIPETSPAKR
jgi:hypothetical protein